MVVDVEQERHTQLLNLGENLSLPHGPAAHFAASRSLHKNLLSRFPNSGYRPISGLDRGHFEDENSRQAMGTLAYGLNLRDQGIGYFEAWLMWC